MPTYLEKTNTWSKKYFDNIKNLAEGASEVISATDFDVEGSLIAWNIIRFICEKNDGKRMRFSTLTTPDIVEAFETASPHLDFPVIEAGLARHNLDWFFGINISRALTLALESVGGYWVLSTGRVQGPTLKILEDREKEIAAFRPVPYWQLLLTCLKEGEILAMHEKEKFWDKKEAEAIFLKCKGGRAVIEKKEKRVQKQNPPVPFDLTSLQREGYNLFGYSPKQTLDITQSLYEQALISYPRTSSQKLPDKIGYKKILGGLAKQLPYGELAKKLLEKSVLRPNEGEKTDSAHPAIFPTGNWPKKMNNYQRKIYDLIVRRFMAVFGEPAVREMTKLTIDVNGEKFIAHGVRTLEANWLEFMGPLNRSKHVVFPAMKEGECLEVKSLEMYDKETEPPPRFTPASVLKDMEVLNLGTKATRAQILQTLYDRGYIKDSSIKVTELGTAVVLALEEHCPEIISVDLTRKFETDMEDIETGKKNREEVVDEAKHELIKILADFKKNHTEVGKKILSAVKNYEKAINTVGKCPKCGSDLMIMHSHRTGKRFVGCRGYPKCSNSFPLPQMGMVKVSERKCQTCTLNIVEVRVKGRRPWHLCVQCGFQGKKKQADAGGTAESSKTAGAPKVPAVKKAGMKKAPAARKTAAKKPVKKS
jgi:DNA topoisomerase-1